jgi:hypothetical protein
MGKPVAGQLGQLGSPTQSQMGGGFGGQQSPMQPQMPQQNPGGMGAFQDFMRQQQASQMPQQPAYGGFGNGMGINIAQPPQSGIQAMPQQDMLNAQQQALTQMQQQPQMPQAQRDEYNRLSAMSPDQRFATLLNQMGPEERGQYNAGIQQAAQDPSTQRQYDAFRSGQGQSMDPNLVRAIEGLRSAAPQQSGFGGQPQMPQMPQQQMPPQNLIAMLQGMGNRLGSTGQPLGEEGFGPVASRPQQQQPPPSPPPPLMRDSGGMPAVPYSQRQPQMPMVARQPSQPPQMPMRAPQQVRPEPPRMQAMRGIQQLANRQRGYNR